MTDTSASGAFPQPQGDAALGSSVEAQDRLLSQAQDGWETVAFPGQLSIIETLEAEVALEAEAHELAGETEALLAPEVAPEAGDPIAGVETAEPAPGHLVRLVQDLNQCNDALLLRVAELEEALERSQVALQAEIERHQAIPGGLPLGTPPGPVQQQIAQLLSELDIANDGLRRTTIHNETLQAELNVNQQRVAQLERECTLLQQRFSEKTTALHQAEETCRDLKARLHRQQRYTLQFKAALEKCLNMAPNARSGSAGADSSGVWDDGVQGQLLTPAPVEEAGQPVTMPRSQQIQPWSSGADAQPQPPNLTQLLRGLRGSGAESAPLGRDPQPQPALAADPSLLAEGNPEPVVAIAMPPAPSAASPGSQSPLPPIPEVIPAPADPWLVEETAEIAPEADVAPLFTEPSPWGEPVAPVEPASVTVAPEPLPAAPPSFAYAAPAMPVSAPAPAAAGASPLPAYLGAQGQPSPSPLVYPLRSQKKIKSIAAVELPSFGRNVRRR